MVLYSADLNDFPILSQDVNGRNESDDEKIPPETCTDPRLFLPPKDVRMKQKVRAAFVSLARNSEVYNMLNSIRHVEDRFNRKFNYDWVFFNDVPFSEEFIKLTSAAVSGKAIYEVIPHEHWSYPEWIDQTKAAKARVKMANVKYGASEPYRHMCRFESGFFWQNPALDSYEYYWRVDSDIELYCDINYDVFKFMKDNDKVYGFTIAFFEFRKTIPTFWKSIKEFIAKYPQYIVEDNLMEFISDNGGKSYNTCHFWTNFEIASLDFWRSEAYRTYFDFLDHKGGFFYERWGDAPVHSVAVSLFLEKDKVHFFEDIGYKHTAYRKCPINADFRACHNCACDPERDWTYKGRCAKAYFKAQGIPIPQEALDMIERVEEEKNKKKMAEQARKEEEEAQKAKAEVEAKEREEAQNASIQVEEPPNGEPPLENNGEIQKEQPH